MTGDLDDVSYLHLLLLVHGARQHQQPLLDREGCAGVPRRGRRGIDRATGRRRARRRRAPERARPLHHAARRPRGRQRRRRPRGVRASHGGRLAARAHAGDRVRPAARGRSGHALPRIDRRTGVEDARRLRRAVLARRRVQRPDVGARFGGGGRRSTPRRRRARRASSRRSRSVPSPSDADAMDPAERRQAVLDALARGWAARARHRSTSSRPLGSTSSGHAAARSRTSGPASSPATDTSSGSPSGACTGRGRRRRRPRTARSTARCDRASAPRPRSSTAADPPAPLSEPA